MSAAAAFRSELVDAGHLVPLGADGVYAYGETFEAIVDGVDALLRRAAGEDSATSLRLPPVCVTDEFVRTGYLSSFPQLAGAVFGFDGDDERHAVLRRKVTANEQWGDELAPAGLMLVSASCQPVFPLFRGSLPAGGRRVALLGQCYRREPSVDPARMQSFRQREFLRLGTADDVATFCAGWVKLGGEVLHQLGLQVAAVAANDPFFGRAGRLLSMNQRESGTKTELAAPLYGNEPDTALASINQHGDNFGRAFGIVSVDGQPAYTGCVGFGLERLVVAMFRVHGVSLDTWPDSVRSAVLP